MENAQKPTDEEQSPLWGKLFLPIRHADAFSALYQGLKRDDRFVPTPDAQCLVDELLDFARWYRLAKISEGSVFFRARINPPQPFRNCCRPFPRRQMSAPPPDRASAGRLNPEGIPYLYLASDSDTAVAEVRPWMSAPIGQCQVFRNWGQTQITDFARDKRNRYN